MKIAKTITVIMLLFVSAGIYAQKAYIQDEAEPGISVFLDNALKGITSSDMGGLVTENVSTGINTTKSKDKWLAEDVPVGSYHATLKKDNKTLSYAIEIKTNKCTHLFVNIMNGKIEKRSVIVKHNSHNSIVSYGYMTDPRDGQTYKTVKIGSQVWMAENLKYLPEVSPSSDGSRTQPYYYVYDYQGTNVSEAKATRNYKTYGVLYNYEAAKSACPSGWHLPSDDEWKTLEMYLGMSQSEANESNGWRATDEGKKLKSTRGWKYNGNGTDAVGFSALPGGDRYFDGSFPDLGIIGKWWSATADGSTDAWDRILSYGIDKVYRYYSNKENGFSVRCVRD